jgi:hypothetical protein
MTFEQEYTDAETPAALSSDAAPDAHSLSSSEPDTVTTPATDTAPGPEGLEAVIDAALKVEQTPPGDAPQADAPADAEGDTDSPATDATDTTDQSTEPAKDGSTPAPDDADEPADAEIAAMPPRARKRVLKLLAQRKEARQQVETLRPDAESYTAVRRFMSENDLTDPEVAELFQLGALMKSGNPDALGKVLERLEPIVNQLRSQLGQSVPDDLQPMVETGEMTEDAARQMARTRAQAQYAETRAQRATQQAQQVNHQVQTAAVTQAVKDWYAQTVQTDPDFGMKSQAVQRAAQALVAERGAPRNPAEAIEYAKAAYAEVNRWFQSARPAPKATRPAPSPAAAPRSGLTPAPASLEDIVNSALEASARR